VKSSSRPLYNSLEDIPGGAYRAVALIESRNDFSLPRAVERAMDILSKNSQGLFLMVEGDMHTDDVEVGLRRALELGGIILRATAKRMPDDDTLIVFTADHSSTCE